MNDIGLMLADKEDYFVDEFGLVPPIIIKDFIKMGEDYEKFYENIILPWRLGWRSFYTITEYNNLTSLYEKIHDYEMFFVTFANGKKMSIKDEYGDEIELIQLLKESIDFIFKCDCEILYELYAFDLKDGRFITGLNYEQICDIIIKTNACDKIKTEEPPTFENDRQRDVYYKLQQGRNRGSKKDKLSIKKLLNIVMVYTRYQINDIIKNMTIHQLFNTYSSLSAEDGYKVNQSYIPVVADMSKLDLEHWSIKLK